MAESPATSSLQTVLNGAGAAWYHQDLVLASEQDFCRRVIRQHALHDQLLFVPRESTASHKKYIRHLFVLHNIPRRRPDQHHAETNMSNAYRTIAGKRVFLTSPSPCPSVLDHLCRVPGWRREYLLPADRDCHISCIFESHLVPS